MKIISYSSQETSLFAESFIAKIKNRVVHAMVIGLYGDLGSGKTTFTQAVAKALGIETIVTSPTFVIEKIYKIDKDKMDTKKIEARHKQSTAFTHLIHIDAYRLEKSDELVRLGWNEIIADRTNLVLIEWPEKVIDIMPDDHVKLKFTFIDETTRVIEVLQ
jgi:tRNA threonylcarbamoyladenosine biosynthesis protein TsaE